MQDSDVSDSNYSGSDDGEKEVVVADKEVAKPNDEKEVVSADKEVAEPDEDEEEDGIVLEQSLLKSDAVRELEQNDEFQRMTKMTNKVRKEEGKAGKFKTMREPMRAGAKAARDAYARAKKSEPPTPDVQEILKVGVLM